MNGIKAKTKMSREHISKRPISKETLEYVEWLTTWMWSKCIDTKTRKVLKEEIDRARKLYQLNQNKDEYNIRNNN